MLAEQAAERLPCLNWTNIVYPLSEIKIKKKTSLCLHSVLGMFWLNFSSSSILLINSTIAVLFI